MKNASDNPILSEGHFIDTLAGKTKLKDKVDGNVQVHVCKYCLQAYENGKIKPYIDKNHTLRDGVCKVYALTKEKWRVASAQSHLTRCPFAPPDVNSRDFRLRPHNK